MNKNIKYLSLLVSLFITTISYGQVRIANSAANSAPANISAFIDASSNNTYNTSTNVGKGLLFPRVDLTKFNAFGGTTGVPTSIPNHYDGFIVYNIAESGEAGVGNTEGTLSRGFWYYDNPSSTLTGGTWKQFGSIGYQ